jgi:hypothetical protein
MTKLGDMFHIPVTDRLNKRRPCVKKTIGRSGTLFCHFLLILVRPNHILPVPRLRLPAAGRHGRRIGTLAGDRNQKRPIAALLGFWACGLRGRCERGRLLLGLGQPVRPTSSRAG